MKLYSFLTGPDDATFCKRVAERLNNGWELYGSPTMTFDGKNVIVGQAVVKVVKGDFHHELEIKKHDLSGS